MKTLTEQNASGPVSDALKGVLGNFRQVRLTKQQNPAKTSKPLQSGLNGLLRNTFINLSRRRVERFQTRADHLTPSQDTFIRKLQ